MKGLLTLSLHALATIVHAVSASLLLGYASSQSWLIVNEFATMSFHFIGILIWTDVVAGVLDCLGSNAPRNKTLEFRRRWLEYILTAGLLEVALVQDASYLIWVLVLFLNLGTQVIGWITDEEDMRELIPYGFLLLAAQILVVFFNTSEPWYTVVLFAILYALFGVVHVGKIDGWLNKDEDHVYTLLSITTKILLTWTIVAHERDDATLEWSVTASTLGGLFVGYWLLPESRDEYDAAPIAPTEDEDVEVEVPLDDGDVPLNF